MPCGGRRIDELTQNVDKAFPILSRQGTTLATVSLIIQQHYFNIQNTFASLLASIDPMLCAGPLVFLPPYLASPSAAGPTPGAAPLGPCLWWARPG